MRSPTEGQRIRAAFVRAVLALIEHLPATDDLDDVVQSVPLHVVAVAFAVPDRRVAMACVRVRAKPLGREREECARQAGLNLTSFFLMVGV